VARRAGRASAGETDGNQKVWSVTNFGGPPKSHVAWVRRDDQAAGQPARRKALPGVDGNGFRSLPGKIRKRQSGGDMSSEKHGAPGNQGSGHGIGGVRPGGPGDFLRAVGLARMVTLARNRGAKGQGDRGIASRYWAQRLPCDHCLELDP